MNCKGCGFPIVTSEEHALNVRGEKVEYHSFQAKCIELLREDVKVKDLRIGELLDLLKKIDAFFENPKIILIGNTLVLDIPYEIAAGVRGTIVDRKPNQISVTGCACGAKIHDRRSVEYQIHRPGCPLSVVAAAPAICMAQVGCMGGSCGKLLPCDDHKPEVLKRNCPTCGAVGSCECK